MRHVPQGLGRACDTHKPESAGDVWRHLMPPSHFVMPGICDQHCVLCTEYHALWHHNRAHGLPLPQWKGGLQTSRSPGPDGLKAELLRFTRSEDRLQTFLFRWQLCGIIASMANRMIDDPSSGLPEEVLAAVVVPVPKGGSTRLDPDPSKVRFIPMMNLVSKACFEHVMASRVMHYALANELVSPTQIGNQQFTGAEHHAFTLHEFAKAANRRGRAVYAVYLDLKKAYPSVHLDALWPLLKHMGLPDKMVNFFTHYYGKR
jgi:hypothetical protein